MLHTRWCHISDGWVLDLRDDDGPWLHYGYAPIWTPHKELRYVNVVLEACQNVAEALIVLQDRHFNGTHQVW